MGRKRRVQQEDETQDDRPTHAQRRREGVRSGALARRLLSLSEADVDAMALPELLKEELIEARRIRSGGALRRQERRVAQVLRDEELDAIEALLDERKREYAQDARRFQRLETWRERLLSDESAAAELRAHEPLIPAAELDALVADARRERDLGRPKGASRALFRRLRDWLAPDGPGDPVP